MCQGPEPCECFPFATNTILGPRCVKLSWANKIRDFYSEKNKLKKRNKRDENQEPDIGPDTCGQDRTLLGAW